MFEKYKEKKRQKEREYQEWKERMSKEEEETLSKLEEKWKSVKTVKEFVDFYYDNSKAIYFALEIGRYCSFAYYYRNFENCIVLQASQLGCFNDYNWRDIEENWQEAVNACYNIRKKRIVEEIANKLLEAKNGK